MKIEVFILKIIKKIESLQEGLIAYAYKDGNAPMTHTWWTVAVSDFEFYMHDKRFRTLTNAWHKAAEAQGQKIVFVCCSPKEDNLLKLSEDNNLIMDV